MVTLTYKHVPHVPDIGVGGTMQGHDWVVIRVVYPDLSHSS